MKASTQIHRLRRRLVVLITGGAAFVLVGGGGLAAVENHVASSYGEGVWWALSLVTTVGFVGEKPETTGGRLVSALLMVAGFAMMTLTTAAIASTFVREEEEPDLAVERDFERRTHELLTAILSRLDALEAAARHDVRRIDPAPDPPPPDTSDLTP